MATLQQLQGYITKAVITGAKADIKLGGYLSQAKAIFEADEKTAKEFYEWSDSECSVKKSQACDLIKVYEGFKDVTHEGLLKLAMRVKLAILRKDLMEQATEALDNGENVDTKWIKAMTEPAAGPVGDENEGGDTSNEGGNESGTSDKGQDQGSEPSDEVAELKEKLAAALKELAEAKSAKRVVYMLPHFASANPYTVLGVEQGSTKTEIRKAWKTLVMIHHPDKCANTELATEITQYINNAYTNLK